MSESGMPPELQQALEAEEERHAKAVSALIAKWPNYRVQIASGMLGVAVAFADTFGVDAEGWLVRLREHEPKPGQLYPPKGS